MVNDIESLCCVSISALSIECLHLCCLSALDILLPLAGDLKHALPQSHASGFSMPLGRTFYFDFKRLPRARQGPRQFYRKDFTLKQRWTKSMNE